METLNNQISYEQQVHEIRAKYERLRDESKVQSEQNKNKYALQMAEIFENNITIGKLLKFITTANDCSMELNKGLSFLNNMGDTFLPDLIECKNRDERIDFLHYELPLFFNYYVNASSIKTEIAELGINFLESYKKLTYEEHAGQFMKIYSAFIEIGEVYDNYSLFSTGYALKTDLQDYKNYEERELQELLAPHA